MKIRLLLAFMGLLGVTAGLAQTPSDVEFDSVSLSLSRQRFLYPQEKIYVHTDKPYYMAGDTIWLRAFVVDASTHAQVSKSKYVYIELQNIDPLSAKDAQPPTQRIRILEREGRYVGYLALPMTAQSGEYSLTAYTAFMLNAGSDYFFRTPLYVSAYGRRYEKQVQTRSGEQNFDVSFYPEGGYLLQDTLCTVGFKALRKDGNSTSVTGHIVDSKGTEIVAFESVHAGMGKITFRPRAGETYYAQCEDENGTSKQFRLPETRSDASILQVYPTSSRFSVQAVTSPTVEPGPLSLLILCRGRLCYFEQLDPQKKYRSFLREEFPDGVLQILLLDAARRPLSERLLFNYIASRQPDAAASPDRQQYGRREKVALTVAVKDALGKPLSGDFAVAVTDNGIVSSFRTRDIRSALLLESELKGYIEDPAYYFDESSHQLAADALMLTQGWRRYDIPSVLQGEFATPRLPIEIGQEITGRVRKTGLLRKRNFKDYRVTAFIPQTEQYLTTDVDKEGRFVLNGFDLPDSTLYILQSMGPDGKTDVELLPDQEHFPSWTNAIPVPDRSDAMLTYNDNLSQYTDSLKHILLEEIVISAAPQKTPKTILEAIAYNSIDAETIQEEHYTNLMEALRSKHGVSIVRDEIKIFGKNVAYLVDNVLWNPYIMDKPGSVAPDSERLPDEQIPMDMIKQIDIISPENTVIYGVRVGGRAIVSITTKTGAELLRSRPDDLNRLYLQSITPLGYQRPVEFYSPKYETARQRNNPQRDLRSTLYWNPTVKVPVDGIVTLDFYAGDNPSNYTLLIEGIAADESSSILHKTISLD